MACPLNDGVAVLDQLLASLMGEAESAAFDSALDLRWLLSIAGDATEIIREFYVLRSLIEERHYLACYRLRRWLESQLVAWVAAERHQPEQRVSLKLDSTCLDRLHDRCLTDALGEITSAPLARVRYAFASALIAV